MASNSGRVFSWSSVDNGVDEDLNGVEVGEQVDDLKGVCDDSDCHQLLSVVASVEHEAEKEGRE